MQKVGLIKIGFVAVLTVLSIGAIIPTLAAPDKDEIKERIAAGEPVKPAWLASYENVWNRKLNLGLDLQGGLLLQYRVEVDKAVRDKADRLADDMLVRLQGKEADIKVETEVVAPRMQQ